MNLASLREHPYSPSQNLAVLLMTLLGTTLIAVIFWLNGWLTLGENSALELAQATLLILASLLHGERAWRFKIASLEGLIHAGLALLTYSFALRELEIDQFGASEFWAHLENTLRLIGFTLWAGLLIVLMWRIKLIFDNRWLILALPVMQLTLWGGFFYIASWPFDKALFAALSPAGSEFIEEVLELNACIFLFFASLAKSSNQRRCA